MIFMLIDYNYIIEMLKCVFEISYDNTFNYLNQTYFEIDWDQEIGW